MQRGRGRDENPRRRPCRGTQAPGTLLPCTARACMWKRSHITRAASGVRTRATVGGGGGIGPQEGWLQAQSASPGEAKTKAEATGRLRGQAGGSIWNGPSSVLPWHQALAGSRAGKRVGETVHASSPPLSPPHLAVSEQPSPLRCPLPEEATPQKVPHSRECLGPQTQSISSR